MRENNIQNKIINATKWSSITEISAKLVSPITNMILARILVPEAFGIVATITMIISFVDMFTDSGFQKYLVQHEFKDEKDKHDNANIAFWTNFGISLLLLGIIYIFREQIATLVGNPGLGNVIAIACLQLPITSFSSIQMALYQRDFDFKTLFLVRIISTFIPFVVTIPLALLGFSYWALIIGTICIQLSNALILTIKSKWKPKLFYSMRIFKEMFSFSIWSLIEAISIWLTIWVDAFIIGNTLSEYYLGLYKTSTTMVNALMALITSATVPVLFSTLSRLQKNDSQFNHVFLKIQRLVSIFVFPLGVGVYLYSDLATKLLLGSQWSEASSVIGIWALTSSIMIVFGSYCSEVYRAKGRPKLSLLAQVLHLIVLVPTIIISAKYGFWVLVYARSWIRLQILLIHFIIMKFSIGIPIFKTIWSVFPTAVSALFMLFLGYVLQQMNEGILWSVVSIIICALFYFTILLFFPNMRSEIYKIGKRIISKV
ncbi:lipopolysaccharide biosynthesis protein [Peribacillus simplex]|uniref:Lipopolysaccharide biosynthesis protein n=1 Tax=Peribacillus simplex TaxID=1478 RepID=A0A8B5XWF8_9BACI|nr:lipopolysaccharide biosynthesis protein [Peribacillus simplex]TVX79107.1 lipopolysaccharide biosynthesis protein [Peribacillus simplex]